MKKKQKTSDKLECSINKKLYKDISKKGTQKSVDKWYRKKVNTFSCYTNVSPSVNLIYATARSYICKKKVLR